MSASYRDGVRFSYPVPSSVALALNVAEQAAQQAESLKLALPWISVKSADGDGFGVSTKGVPALYDFFEQCMISVVFSFQAIETFANAVIGRELKQSMKVRRGRKLKELTPEELARQLSTNDKLKWVLPAVKKVESPEGTPKWKRFERLEEDRHAAMHLKVGDQFGKDRSALFFKFLDLKIAEYPSAAAMIIHHYFKPDAEPRWLLKYLRVRDHS